MNVALSQFKNWADENHVIVNPSKSMSMIVSNKNMNFTQIPPVMYDNNIINFVEKVRSLGIILNSKLNFDDHISKLCGEVSSCLGMLYQSKSFTPITLRLKLVKSLIIPKFLYCSYIYFSCSRKNWDKLKVSFNDCARYIFNLNRFDSVSEFSFRILNCDIENYLKFRACLFVFNLLKYQLPNYLFELLIFPRIQRNKLLNLPSKCNSLQYRNSFFVAGIKLWNSINVEIRRIESKEVFRRECLSFLASRRF